MNTKRLVLNKNCRISDLFFLYVLIYGSGTPVKCFLHFHNFFQSGVNANGEAVRHVHSRVTPEHNNLLRI